MHIDRTECDLCRNVITVKNLGKSIVMIRDNVVLTDNLHDSDVHLCNHCLISITEQVRSSIIYGTELVPR